ncbi:LysE family transporter [Pusillimonas sp. ANT_WB101]|uniref:LysE family transporter n=1 Tax=Pusillimonas sp. ANT_WB101 TaxID=2597356 RepID=UPI0011EE0452|nr:LysE family transporter [Pusillimonas sp. ANT_WB101]KAA0889601.1 threonine transporter RhtB [Pusillimonas sp. ANT_WB101]
MSLSTWLAFFAASWAISFSPGPGAISAMASGLKHGFRRGYWTTIGLQIGLLIQFVVVAVGLGALLAASETAFGIIKWLGVAYLVYLGWCQFRTDAAPVAVSSGRQPHVRVREIVARGILINVTNPKGTVFLLAVVPQFLDLTKPMALQYVIIAATLCFTDLIAMGCYTTLASRMLKVFRSPRHVRWLNRGFGALFILAGTVLASFSHHR